MTDTIDMAEPARPDDDMDVVATTLDSTEPTPPAETAQAPRMFGEFDAPFVLVLGLGESGLAMARWCARHGARAVSYTHLTLPTTCTPCRSRWSPYH